MSYDLEVETLFPGTADPLQENEMRQAPSTSRLPRWWVGLLIVAAALGPLPGHGGFNRYFPVGRLMLSAPFESGSLGECLMNLGWAAAWLAAYMLVLYVLSRVVLWGVSQSRKPGDPRS